MTPTELKRIGEALYGERFQTNMAVILGVNDRTVRHWIAGTYSIPEYVRTDLAAVVATRMTKLSKVLSDLQDVGL